MKNMTKGLVIATIMGLGSGIVAKKLLNGEAKVNLNKVKELAKEKIDKSKEHFVWKKSENTSNIEVEI